MSRKKQVHVAVQENITQIKSVVQSKQRKLIEDSKNIGEIPFMTYEIIRNKFFHVK